MVIYDWNSCIRQKKHLMNTAIRYSKFILVVEDLCNGQHTSSTRISHRC